MSLISTEGIFSQVRDGRNMPPESIPAVSGLFSVMPTIVREVVSFLTGMSGVSIFIFDGSNTLVTMLILCPMIESAGITSPLVVLPKSMSPSILMPSLNSVALLSTMLFSLSLV